MKFAFIRSSEKRRIVEDLKEKFGIENIPYLLIEAGREKIRAFSGHISKEEIIRISSILNVDNIGLYIIKKDSDLRLSFDAPHLLKEQISKNVIEINEEQFNKWIRGHDLDMKVPKGIYLISYDGDLIGSGISNSICILNHVPKDRRLKTQVPSDILFSK